MNGGYQSFRGLGVLDDVLPKLRGACVRRNFALCAIYSSQLELACLVCGHWPKSGQDKEADFLHGTACRHSSVGLPRVVATITTRILADQGAEVIKVEPPEGDLREPSPLLENEITSTLQQNAGKLFCSFDLSHDETPQLVAELATKCDVIVENFRPGVMAKYGLDYETLSKKNPRLVYCSITGFGQTGPWANRRAYAPIGHLESGLIEYDERKNDRPARQPSLVLGDSVTALSAATSINAMLVQAERRGTGGHLDV